MRGQKVYKRILDSLMSSVHRLGPGQQYEYNRVYTEAEKRQVTPEELLRWLNMRRFGVPDPAPDTMIRPLVRANTIAFWKKAISFHMPDRLDGWRTGSNDGNPIKCAEVNDFVKYVKKLEARKQGAASQTRRPMVENEFRRLHEVFKTFGGPHSSAIWKYGMPALMNFQFHMIARIDDTTQVIMDHIRVHDNFENALKTRLNWSKNVQDECDAPWQIVLGSMNPVFCVYISLGLWLETNLRASASAMASPYVFAFSDDITIPGGGQKAKETAQNIFGQKVLKLQEFQTGGLLGSHSIRKFASTHVRRCGISKDDKDTRGRWKGKGRVSDRYDDVELPYPDCKVAEKLCMGGACYYVIDNSLCNSNTLKTFVLTKVVPNIRQRLPESAAIVLGKAVLWLVYSSVACDFISATDRDRVKADLADTGTVILDGQNPIAKVPIIVSGNQGTVFIDEIPRLPDLDGFAAGANNNNVDDNGGALQGLNARRLNMQILENNQISGDKLQNWMLQLQSGFMSLRRENVELRSEIAGIMQAMERGFQIVNGNMRRMALQPSRRRAVLTTVTTTNANDGAENGEGTAADDVAAGERALLAPALAMTNPATLRGRSDFYIK
ncbi:hypothetical protein MHU86_16723 [Fragilaria crotonensis]|nr:hypothetical protein MHU86_16723 [Fragilaria crotonensis]